MKLSFTAMILLVLLFLSLVGCSEKLGNHKGDAQLRKEILEKGSLNPGRFLPDKCFFQDASFQCDYAKAEKTRIDLKIKHSLTESLIYAKVSVPSCKTSSTISPMDPEKDYLFQLSDCENKASAQDSNRFKEEFMIEFLSSSGKKDNIKGSLDLNINYEK